MALKTLDIGLFFARLRVIFADLGMVFANLRAVFADLKFNFADLRGHFHHLTISSGELRGRDRRQVAVPTWDEVLPSETLALLFSNPLGGAAADAKIFQIAAKVIGIERFAFVVATPRTSSERIEILEKVRGENLVRAAADKEGANVLKQVSAG